MVKLSDSITSFVNNPDEKYILSLKQDGTLCAVEKKSSNFLARFIDRQWNDTIYDLNDIRTILNCKTIDKSKIDISVLSDRINDCLKKKGIDELVLNSNQSSASPATSSHSVSSSSSPSSNATTPSPISSSSSSRTASPGEASMQMPPPLTIKANKIVWPRDYTPPLTDKENQIIKSELEILKAGMEHDSEGIHFIYDRDQAAFTFVGRSYDSMNDDDYAFFLLNKKTRPTDTEPLSTIVGITGHKLTVENPCKAKVIVVKEEGGFKECSESDLKGPIDLEPGDQILFISDDKLQTIPAKNLLLSLGKIKHSLSPTSAIVIWQPDRKVVEESLSVQRKEKEEIEAKEAEKKAQLLADQLKEIEEKEAKQREFDELLQREIEGPSGQSGIEPLSSPISEATNHNKTQVLSENTEVSEIKPAKQLMVGAASAPSRNNRRVKSKGVITGNSKTGRKPVEIEDSTF